MSGTHSRKSINAKFVALLEHAELFAQQFKRTDRRRAVVLKHLGLAELTASPDGPPQRLAAHCDLDVLDQIGDHPLAGDFGFIHDQSILCGSSRTLTKDSTIAATSRASSGVSSPFATPCAIAAIAAASSSAVSSFGSAMCH